jgi:hypothetical protein
VRAGRIEIRGEVFVTLAAVAECYRIEPERVEEFHAAGLIGGGERVEGALAVPAAELDRLAAVLRWHRHLGLELEAIAALLAP